MFGFFKSTKTVNAPIHTNISLGDAIKNLASADALSPDTNRNLSIIMNSISTDPATVY